MQFKLCLWSSHHYIIPINTHIDRLHAQFPSGYRTKLRHWRTRLKLPSLRVWNLKLPALCIKIYIYIYIHQNTTWLASFGTHRNGLRECGCQCTFWLLIGSTAIICKAANVSSQPVTMARSANKWSVPGLNLQMLELQTTGRVQYHVTFMLCPRDSFATIHILTCWRSCRTIWWIWHIHDWTNGHEEEQHQQQTTKIKQNKYERSIESDSRL